MNRSLFLGACAALGLLALVGCTQPSNAIVASADGAEPNAALSSSAAAQTAAPQGAPARQATGWTKTTVVAGLNRPWGIAWLPDGNMIITERGGGLWLVTPEGEKTAIEGAPASSQIGQGGLMDVSLHPDFRTNNLVYFTFTEGNNQGNRTAIARGQLRGTRLVNLETIFRVADTKRGGQHFGSRIEWLPDKTFLVSIGDGGNPPSSIGNTLTRDLAQSLGSHLGKVLRLDGNGKAPRDNPFVGRQGALPEIYSYGHRNIQGLARDPQSGRIWANEHGARGGDEINLIEAGKNYGWPLATYSVEYSGPKISDNTSLPGMVDPVVVWTPCPAPSGLIVYTGNQFTAWKGDLFSGGLAGNDIRRVDLDSNGKVQGQEQLRMGVRIRDVRQGPDGNIYALTDEGNGELIRISPSR